MTTNHINDLQNPYSYEQYVNEYLNTSLSSLANSGQRFGINANGIKYINKTCQEIFGLYDYNINDYLLELHLDYNSLKYIKVVDKKSKKSINNKEIEFINKLNIKDINDNETINNLMNYLFNDIDLISDDSYITIDNNLFTGFLKGRISGELSSNPENSKLVYFQYDVNNNTLLHYIITQKYGVINDYSDWYIIYKLDYAENNKYTLSIYLYRLEWLVNLLSEDFNISDDVNITNSDIIKRFYQFNFNNKEQLLSFFNNNFVNYDNFTYNGSFIDKVSFLNYVFNYDFSRIAVNEDYYKFKLIEFNVPVNNTFKEINISDTVNEIYTNENDLLGYITKQDLHLYFINLQNLYTIYTQLYSYYNQITFFNTKTNSYIYQYIIYKIYEYLRNEFDINDDDVLYIPLSYMFNCFVSDTNEINVYYMDNIYVKFLNNENNLSTYKNQIYYIHKKITNHVSIYRVHINYNISNIINNIIVSKLYTLPYLNRLNNWVIDDFDTSTSIYQNQYSGIKELYVYNELVNGKIQNDVLNFSDESIKQYINNYEEKEFTINQKYFVKYQGTNIRCKVNIPNLSNVSDDIIEFFKNTIIIAICNKNLIDEEYRNDYQLDYVYSLWRLNETVFNSGEFELISFEKDSDQNLIAFDPYNNISYIDKEQTYKYIQSLSTANKFDTNQSSTINNQTCMVMRNKHGLQYHNQYLNNLNAIIEYVPELNVDESGNNPNYDVTKYIEDISELQITNILYPIYDKVFIVQSTEEIQSYLAKQVQSNYTTYITVNVNSANRFYTEWLTKNNYTTVYNNIQELVKIYKKVEIAVQSHANSSSNLDYYNEYVFNENIPSMDYKELVLRNINSLNRVNLLGIDYNEELGTIIYNGFIGTKFDKNINKNILYISTNTNNINIGNDTLFNSSQNNKFTKYDTFQVDEFNNINLINSSEYGIKISDENININCNKLNLQSENIINLNNQIINSKYSLHKEEFINNNPYQNLTSYSVSIKPQGFLGNNIFVAYDFSHTNSLNLFVDTKNNINDITNWLFMPIYYAVTNNTSGKTQERQIKDNLNNNQTKFKFLYNSLILDNIIYDIFGTELLGDNPIIYVCNNNNKILEIKLSEVSSPYHLLLFNDLTVNIRPIHNNNFYKIFNHQLNIILTIDNITQQRTIFINFEIDTIDTLNKTEAENVIGSAGQITNYFTKYMTNTLNGDDYIKINSISVFNSLESQSTSPGNSNILDEHITHVVSLITNNHIQQANDHVIDDFDTVTNNQELNNNSLNSDELSLYNSSAVAGNNQYNPRITQFSNHGSLLGLTGTNNYSIGSSSTGAATGSSTGSSPSSSSSSISGQQVQQGQFNGVSQGQFTGANVLNPHQLP